MMTEKDMIEKLWSYRDRVLSSIEASDDGTHELLRVSVKDYRASSDDIDRQAICHTVREKVKLGWSSHDILSYVRCTEHVDPVLPEDTALSMMKTISSRYAKAK